jgi:Uma2 family endonuclease
MEHGSLRLCKFFQTKGDAFMSSLPETFLTEAEYLAQERRAEHKSQYYRGEVFAMAGATRRHNLIAMNVGTSLSNQLRERDCEVYPSDMKVKVSPTGLYTYPDISVTCENPEFVDAVSDVLLNPRLIVEVLPDSTEAYDRGPKFEQYRQLASLKDYLLVAQKRMHAELYARQASGSWLLTEFRQPEQEIILESVGCRIRLAELYAKVSLAESEEST